MHNLGVINEFVFEEKTPEETMETETPYIHIVEVTAPPNVDDWIKDKLHNLCSQLSDDEMAYAIVYINQELEKAQEIELENAGNYEDIELDMIHDEEDIFDNSL